MPVCIYTRVCVFVQTYTPLSNLWLCFMIFIFVCLSFKKKIFQKKAKKKIPLVGSFALLSYVLLVWRQVPLNEVP